FRPLGTALGHSSPASRLSVPRRAVSGRLSAPSLGRGHGCRLLLWQHSPVGSRTPSRFPGSPGPRSYSLLSSCFAPRIIMAIRRFAPVTPPRFSPCSRSSIPPNTLVARLSPNDPRPCAHCPRLPRSPQLFILESAHCLRPRPIILFPVPS